MPMNAEEIGYKEERDSTRANQIDKEHNPPHVHAFYGEKCAIFSILNGEMLNGDFPKKGIKMVQEFINRYRDELLEMWATGLFKRLPGLE